MELSEIKPAFFDLKEHIEAQDIRIDMWEERMAAIEQSVKRILRRLEALDGIFAVRVGDR